MMNERNENKLIEEAEAVIESVPAEGAEPVAESIYSPAEDIAPEDDFRPIVDFDSLDDYAPSDDGEPAVPEVTFEPCGPRPAGDVIKHGKARKIGGYFSHNVIIAILAAIWLIPIIWLVCTSFSSYDGMNTSTFFPKEWSVDHYRRLFQSDSVNQFPTWFMNTLKIAIATCVISTMFTLMVAYATSFGKFKARKPLMNFAVILNLFPGVLSMIAVYFVLKTFGLTNSHIGLILVYSGSSGLGYLICKGFFDTLPRVLCEAARIDGCSEARTFFQIIMPMSKPIIVYTVISSFLGPWMDFVFAKMILNAGVSQYYTVAVGLYKMLDKSLLNNYFTIFCCGGVLVAVPISILFFIMQKFYVEGITGGSVKG